MATIIYNSADEGLARRIEADLRGEATLNTDMSVIVLISPQANTDPDVAKGIGAALDANRHVVPVLAQPAPLPRLIEHLPPVDFTGAYAFEALRERLQMPEGEMHLRVRTPAVIAANRRVGAVVAVLALIMFVTGLYLVGVMGIQAPVREYEQVETEIILTRNYFVDEALPRSTEDAANFQVTVDAARPTLRPVLIATATALAEQGE